MLFRSRPALTRDELDLAALVEEIVQEYRHRTGRDIRYTSAAPSLIGEWDRLRVERVVDNLLSNALKYSPVTAPVLVLVGATSSATGRTVTIEVRDSGRGIPRGEEEAVWQRFRRGSNTGEIPGQGVGLASVRQIVQEHGGTVTLRGAEGQGTVATVRLPWPEDDAPDPDDPEIGRAHV